MYKKKTVSKPNNGNFLLTLHQNLLRLLKLNKKINIKLKRQ